MLDHLRDRRFSVYIRPTERHLAPVECLVGSVLYEALARRASRISVERCLLPRAQPVCDTRLRAGRDLARRLLSHPGLGSEDDATSR
jgi:hypothetical protein